MIAHNFRQELLERYGSPLYIYDLDEAERQAKALFELLPESAQVLYSVKANPIPEVCAALKTAGCGMEIASPRELKVVQEAGCAPDQIVCSGPGKTASLVREMLLAGVTHFSCDSWHDLERLSTVASETKTPAKALLRLQVSGAPAGSVGVGALQSHFGADPAELLNGGVERVSALRGAELTGIHIYSGGQIQSADKLAGTFKHGYPSRRTNRSGRSTSAPTRSWWRISMVILGRSGCSSSSPQSKVSDKRKSRAIFRSESSTMPRASSSNMVHSGPKLMRAISSCQTLLHRAVFL